MSKLIMLKCVCGTSFLTSQDAARHKKNCSTWKEHISKLLDNSNVPKTIAEVGYVKAAKLYLMSESAMRKHFPPRVSTPNEQEIDLDKSIDQWSTILVQAKRALVLEKENYALKNKLAAVQNDNIILINKLKEHEDRKQQWRLAQQQGVVGAVNG